MNFFNIVFHSFFVESIILSYIPVTLLRVICFQLQKLYPKQTRNNPYWSYYDIKHQAQYYSAHTPSKDCSKNHPYSINRFHYNGMARPVKKDTNS